MDATRGALAALLTGIAATLVVVALAILPFLTPAWVAFGQTRAQADLWTGFTPEQLRTVTDQILADLVLGPPAFDVTLDGVPVLKESERAHMRDVRGVFLGFFAVAAVAAVMLVALFLAAREPAARRRLWRRLERTGIVIVAVTVVGGAVGVVLFEPAFTLFHEIFFPGGNWQFDPLTDRLVQLFPEAFWVESTIGVGVAIIAIAFGMTVLARWRGRVLASRAGEAARPGSRPEATR
jgi:integral membrane protein (TIGR01906 family)